VYFDYTQASFMLIQMVSGIDNLKCISHLSTIILN